jgi:hypothetical protein
LRLIRRELRELSLDWESPEFLPAATAPRSPIPVKVQIRFGKGWVAAGPDKQPAKPHSKPAS